MILGSFTRQRPLGGERVVELRQIVRGPGHVPSQPVASLVDLVIEAFQPLPGLVRGSADRQWLFRDREVAWKPVATAPQQGRPEGTAPLPFPQVRQFSMNSRCLPGESPDRGLDASRDGGVRRSVGVLGHFDPEVDNVHTMEEARASRHGDDTGRDAHDGRRKGHRARCLLGLDADRKGWHAGREGGGLVLADPEAHMDAAVVAVRAGLDGALPDDGMAVAGWWVWRQGGMGGAARRARGG
jgi:hypothetical protein